MPTIQASELTHLARRILEAAGAPPDYADIVSAHLVDANLTGHDSHGVIRISQYVGEIDQGRLEPAGAPRVTDETASMAQIDGAATFGQVTAGLGSEIAIGKARASGLALVTMYNIGHTGRLGAYAEMAADAGLAAMIWDGVIGGPRAIVIPLNGSGRKLGANPIAMGFPSAQYGRVILDFATSMSAAGKVRVADAKGEALPAEWIVDAAGRPTTDASKLNPDGALRPLGLPSVGHKGYALAFMTGLLTMMATMPTGAKLPAGDRWGTLIFMIDIARFGPLDVFRREVDEAIAYVKSDPLQGEVLYPGEPEARQRRARSAAGIDIPDATWNDILALLRRFGLPPPD